MNIVQAALTVMRRAGRPLTAADVCEAIQTQALYTFRAKQPVQIVLQQLRRHCAGFEGKSAARTKYFERSSASTYSPLSEPISSRE
jgi:hypothetical protein